MTTATLEQPTTAIELVIPPDVTNIETAAQLRAAALPFYEKANKLCADAASIVVLNVNDKQGMERAKDARLAIADVRKEAERTRVAMADESLRKKQAIDKVFNGLRDALKEHEARLLESETFAQRALDAEKAARKAERERKLAAYGIDPSVYPLADMTDKAFAELLDAQDQIYARKQEGAAQAERDRKAKEEADAAERKRLQEEAAKANAERDAALAKQRETEAQAHKDREAAEAVARTEREAREKLEREKKARADAEAKKLSDEKKAQAKAARAPDREKIIAYVDALRALPLPECRSQEAIDFVAEIKDRVETMTDSIESESLKL